MNVKHIFSILSIVAFSQEVLAAPVETRVASRFSVFAAANNDSNGRYSAIIVSAMHGTFEHPTIVDLIDDDADGDDDDTLLAVALQKGEHLVRYIKDGSINDDYQGNWDGDLFHVFATQPVSVLLVTDSDWQHDWAPSSNGTLAGQEFFLYANGTSVSPRDVNAFAYVDDTRVELWKISEATLNGSGVSTRGVEQLLLSKDLDEGEDLLSGSPLGIDLLAKGESYRLVSNRPITVMFGALGALSSDVGVRDGGGFVPGRSGRSVDDDFYFSVPHDEGRAYEKEIRIISAHDSVVATLLGFDQTTESFVVIESFELDKYEHADVVGESNYSRYRLLVEGGKAVLFEGNWLETGAPGTSDVASFAPGFYDDDGAGDFIVYVSPPGHENRTQFGATLAHVLLFADAATSFVATDVDTDGSIFSLSGEIGEDTMKDLSLDVATWNQLNRPSEGIRPYLRVQTDGPLSVCMANFNDNWMAYASSVHLRNPILSTTAPIEVAIGDEFRIQTTVRFEGVVDLEQVLLRALVPTGALFFGATFAGNPPSNIEFVDEGTLVSFEMDTLSAETNVLLDVSAQLESGANGSLVGVDVVVSGFDAFGRISSGETTSFMVKNRDSASALNLASTPSNKQVLLTFDIENNTSFYADVFVERVVDGEITLLAAPGVPSETGLHSSSFVDDNLQNGKRYFYSVLVVANGEENRVGPISEVPTSLVPPSPPTLASSIENLVVELTANSSEAGETVLYQRSVSGSGLWVSLGYGSIGDVFSDESVAFGIDFSYRCRTIDEDGLFSAWSNIRSHQVAPPIDREARVVLRYEDMIGEGENDWDYNDWIVDVTSYETFTNGNLTELQLVVSPLARGAGYVHQFKLALPLVGSWSSTVTTFGDEVLTSVQEGSGPLDLVLFDDTRDPLPPQRGNYTNTSPQQAGYYSGDVVVVEVHFLDENQILNGSQTLSIGDAPWDLYLQLPYLSTPNEIHREGFSGAVEMTSHLPELPDAFLPFVIEQSLDETEDPQWSFEGRAIWLDFVEFVDFVEDGGLFSPALVSENSVFHKLR
ncbi:MAG: LruC domain-containing protein [Deltaproteobacteria bacterium]|nr:LruC domain-containing protein [Deltaproteobacteria bacterium]